MCSRNGNIDAPESNAQNILRNLNAHETVLRMLRLKVTDENADILVPCFRACYRFLRQFTLNNIYTSAAVQPSLKIFIAHLAKPTYGAANALIEVLRDDKERAMELGERFINHVMGIIDKEYEKAQEDLGTLYCVKCIIFDFILFF